MMNHIDVSRVLRQALACDLYSNLVTRPTGAAVRQQIERLLRESGDRVLTVIDFSHVSMIDFSCADEVVAKLLMRYSSDDSPQEAYFIFRGLSDDHWDAIEAVLERHELALAIEDGERVRLAGVLPDDERRAWEAVYRLGHATPEEAALALEADIGRVRESLDALARRRLVMNVDGGYAAVGGGYVRG